MQILNKGDLSLLDMMGSDETIAKAAWVSYAKQDEKKEAKDIERLINYLMKHQHGTPFEHVVFQFHIKAPIFIAREWFRHRIGSFNEVSSRYITFEPEFYIPEQFRVKSETNKQGSVIPDDYIGKAGWNNWATEELTQSYKDSYNSYLALKEQGVANELARLLLPLGTYTEWWWTVNLRSLFNFMALRSFPTAQWEIQEYSRALEEIVKEKLPYAYMAWENNGRNAP
jgi:thymidylate synthase (FAD)